MSIIDILLSRITKAGNDIHIGSLHFRISQLVFLYEVNSVLKGVKYFYLHGNAGQIKHIVNLFVDAREHKMSFVFFEY